MLLPLVLLPSAAWHVLRTLGWHHLLSADVRPSFWRLFRVRLAADAVSYFTIRGLASEPLRVVLLLDRVPAAVSTASTILERTAMGVMSVVLVGLTAVVAMSSDVVPEDWQRVFRGIAIVAVIVVVLDAALPDAARPLSRPALRGGLSPTRAGAGPKGASRTSSATSRPSSCSWRVRIGVACGNLVAAGRRRATRLMALEIWLVFWAIG